MSYMLKLGHQNINFPSLTTDVTIDCHCRKDQNLLSPVNCWYLLLNQVRRESKDHATLSDIYLNNVIMRFMQISEDSTRLLKKVSMLATTRLNLNYA